MIEAIVLIVLVVVSFWFGWSVATNLQLDEQMELVDIIDEQNQLIRDLMKKLKEKADDGRNP